MNSEESNAIYFISVASSLSGIHQQTIRTYENKGLIKPFRTGGGTRRYSQNDIDKVLDLEPRHFGALSGLGMIHLRLGDPERALKAYEDLVNVFPSNADAVQKIITLKNYLGINTL